jgi:glycosyltransferase involved in cell wall biosynthesis
MMDYRSAYGLPERYFLSLGRMVEKKNLSTLVEAYARFARESVERSRAETGNLKLEGSETADGGPGGVASPPQAEGSDVVTSDQLRATRDSLPALVFVGSGELESALREQARALGLRVVDRTGWKVNGREEAQEDGGQGTGTRQQKGFSREEPEARGGGTEMAHRQPQEDKEKETGPPVRGAYGSERQSSETRDSLPATSHEENRGTVFFYGFRQIEENANFYALAEAFVLPSLKEEWGLVVNEAMAAGLPVIVSRTAGCAEDLVPKTPASRSSQLAVGSVQSGEEKKTEDCKPTTEDSLEERSNGFVFDPKSSDALSDALRRIADQEPEPAEVGGDSVSPRDEGRGQTKRPKDEETNGLTEMGKRSREIVAKFGCENFARQALRAAEKASAP